MMEMVESCWALLGQTYVKAFNDYFRKAGTGKCIDSMI